MIKESSPSILAILVKLENGSLLILEDKYSIKAVSEILPRDLPWKKSSSIEKLRNKYFQLVNELAKETNLGYTKTDLHNSIKVNIMKKFEDFPHYFSTNEPECSTKHLNYEGWVAMIEQLKVYALDIFGYTFKN